MRRLLAVLPVVAACLAIGPLHAQDPAQVDQERARIAAERRAADGRYAQAEEACYRRFAVNDCLNEAKIARREVLADLRRQEVSLNDAERRRKGAAQQQRLEERSSPEAQQRAAQQRAQALADNAQRQERGARKAAQAAAPAAAVAAPRVPAQPSAATMPDAAAAARHQTRLQEAKARKERLQKRQKERTKPAAQPLPVPAS